MLVQPAPPHSPGVDGGGPWLPQAPPPSIARLAGWLVIAVFALAAWIVFEVDLPESVRCRFTLAPEGGADPVQAPIAGVLHAVPVTEGMQLDAGAVLVEIRSGEILTWQTRLRAARDELQAARSQATRTQQAHEALLQIKAAELDQVQSERIFRQQHLDTVDDLVSRHWELCAAGYISEVEMLQTQLSQAGARKDLSVTDQAIEKVKLQRQELETQRERQRMEEQAAEDRLRLEIESLERRLVDSEGDLRRVTAPYRAVVLHVARKNAGSVVREGEELCQLAPVNARVHARLVLPQSGLDRVRTNQMVRLHFDAFPYQRYGAITGRLDWISPGAVQTADTPRFEALASLAFTEFTIRGEPVTLRAGMAGEARIRVGSRTLKEFALEPLRALRMEVR